MVGLWSCLKVNRTAASRPTSPCSVRFWSGCRPCRCVIGRGMTISRRSGGAETFCDEGVYEFPASRGVPIVTADAVEVMWDITARWETDGYQSRYEYLGYLVEEALAAPDISIHDTGINHLPDPAPVDVWEQLRADLLLRAIATGPDRPGDRDPHQPGLRHRGLPRRHSRCREPDRTADPHAAGHSDRTARAKRLSGAYLQTLLGPWRATRERTRTRLGAALARITWMGTCSVGVALLAVHDKESRCSYRAGFRARLPRNKQHD